MNKNEFLEELNRHLLILEDEEQQDILEEYSQHIDMKVESGLSEDEAIRDFGSVKELAAQILEAYHVKAEFSGDAAKDGRKLPVKPITVHGADLRDKFARFFKKLSAAARHGAVCCYEAGKAIGRKAAYLILCPIRKIRSLLHREEKTVTIDTERKKREHRRTSAGVSGRAVPVMHTLGHSIAFAIGSCFHGIIRLCLWGLKWCWNLFMMFLALFGGLFVLGSLFCFGILIVWLFKGYPLKGLTLVMFGTVLCSGAFTCFCVSLLRMNKTNRFQAEETAVSLTEEVQDA
ncbi:uncharacterized protein DUF1700 [Hungatella effluvii]|uniref:Uncharacterized protein DUF1700 n=1 Tax=Hungatella effluvii TaxID=1096246 RepID=A0A2V3YI90_9FIRM|nr:DUF1700 domain-containing protein [Hungatella effluvii]PXX52998.1 uncharacterized protein DUF1700 [Hungatella effluvii]